MITFQSLTQRDLADLILPLSRVKNREGDLEVKRVKQARYRAKQIFHWVYQRGVTDWDGMSDLSKDLRAWLKDHVEIARLKERQMQRAQDGTRKFLWEMSDGKTVEGVIIPSEPLEEGGDVDSDSEETAPGATAPAVRLTACISSQVGCAMACGFCLTAAQGFERNLEVHEIVGQIFELRRIAPITNIVFMGMGEPLRNLDSVVKACEIFLDQDGFGFSKRKVTVSTSGVVPGIEELGRRIDVSLAISLNATTDEQRSRIMPVNKKWNIEALLGACRAFPLGKHRRITFEYVLLGGFNDSLEDAARLAQMLRGIPSKINLIPFNEHPASPAFKRPSDDAVLAFRNYLIGRGYTATVRVSRGRDISAACGQLRSECS